MTRLPLLARVAALIHLAGCGGGGGGDAAAPAVEASSLEFNLEQAAKTIASAPLSFAVSATNPQGQSVAISGSSGPSQPAPFRYSTITSSTTYKTFA